MIRDTDVIHNKNLNSQTMHTQPIGAKSCANQISVSQTVNQSRSSTQIGLLPSLSSSECQCKLNWKLDVTHKLQTQYGYGFESELTAFSDPVNSLDAQSFEMVKLCTSFIFMCTVLFSHV